MNKIIVENSTWNNLGDGFYQFSLYELIKEIFPQSNVFMGEGPVKRAFHPNTKQLKNALRVSEYEIADLHVFSGPIVMAISKPEYSVPIKKIVERGGRYALISVSCSGLFGEPLEEVRAFLKKYPPVIFSSRDPETYEKFKDYVPSSYNGICTAFLVDNMLNIDKIILDKKYFISSFYRNPEPIFKVKSNDICIDNIELIPNNNLINKLPYRLSRHLQIFNDVQDELNGFKIVRAVQQVSNKSNNFNFKHPNSFITFNPLNLLSVIKGAEFTISERVHACATTLAFGRPARILIDSPRCGIFERFGFDWKSNDGIMKPDSQFLKTIELEKNLLVEYIKNNIKEIE